MNINNQSKGTFIAIEGSDGSGKGTQVAKLVNRLKTEGYPVMVVDFPQYGEPSAHFIEKYLNGEYGDIHELGPYTPSYFYALDRFAAKDKIDKALSEGKIVIANRFTGSNMAHQGAKFERREERLGFFTWVDQLEFETMKIPRPNLNIILSVPAKIGQELVDKKEKRNYTDKKRDVHEQDFDFLKKSVAAYEDLATLFSKHFVSIDCTRNGKIMDVNEIHKLIWERIKTVIPDKPKKDNPSALKATTKDGKKTSKKISPYVTKNDNGSFSISKMGEDYLRDVVTNTDKDVYAFTEKLSPITIAAAMARLSRRGDDMRVTLLDEFAGKEGKDSSLLKRVISAYGDDSVQQLASMHLVVENASNILTKKLEWGRLGSYLEQSTRYIYYDQKDEKGNYRYHTPKGLSADVAKSYEKTMDDIFDLYSKMVHKLTTHVRNNSSVPEAERDFAWKGATKAQACDAIRPVLPVSTRSTVGIFVSGQALESLIMHLLSDNLRESRATGQIMLEEARKIFPMFLERADKPNRGGATIAYRSNTFNAVRKVAEENLPQHYSNDQESSLTSVWPRNELELIPHMLYEHSNLSVKELKEAVSEWSFQQKHDAFAAYMGERLNRRHKPGRALEQAHYSWDLVCDYGIFRDLQRHRMVDDLQWQELSPRFGYDTSELVIEADLSDMYDECFKLSYKLYSEMQAAGFELEAQYATLMGHKLRWKIMYNARQAFHFHELRTAPQGHPGYRQLVKQMHDEIAKVHPMLAEAMIFVNKDEDEELTRLASERYTQFKLNQCDD